MYKSNEIKQLLEQADNKLPKLRFCQLLLNALYSHGIITSSFPELFYLRDEIVIEALRHYLDQHEN